MIFFFCSLLRKSQTISNCLFIFGNVKFNLLSSPINPKFDKLRFRFIRTLDSQFLKLYQIFTK